ncbi:hypothetical protein Unana1_08172 [Umbelopsis nana]
MSNPNFTGGGPSSYHSLPSASTPSYAGYPFNFAVQGGGGVGISHRPHASQTPQQFIQQLQQQQSMQRQRAVQLELQRQQHELLQQQQQHHQQQQPVSAGSPGSASGRKVASKADRRAEHNAIERARRESLNTKFQELAHSLPNLQNDRRPSKGTIIERTLDFVKRTIVQEERYRTEIERLRDQNKQLRARLGSMSAESSPEPSISHAGSWMDETNDLPGTSTVPWNPMTGHFPMQDSCLLFNASGFPDASFESGGKLSPSPSPGSDDDSNSQHDEVDISNLKSEDTSSLSHKSGFNLSTSTLELTPYGHPFAMNDYGQHTP